MKGVAIRAAVTFSVSVVVLALIGVPASAAPSVPNGTEISFSYETTCDFPVDVLAVSGQLARATLPNGLQVITGPARATVTNRVTGQSATYNLSGPTLYDQATSRVTVFGLNLIGGPEGQVNPGEDPFLIVTAGRVSFVLNQPIDDPLRGHILHDVCAELSG
jgi:hypothetical protein